jgi:fibronectin type III domain protein
MGSKSTLAMCAALLTVVAWVTPSDGTGDTRSPALDVAVSPMHATSDGPTNQGGAPRFKVGPVSRIFGSAPKSGVHQPIFRGGARPSRPLSTPGPAVRTPRTTTAPRVAVYSGLNQPGMVAGDNVFQETPPDASGAIGPTRYVEVVNSRIAVYNRSNLSLVSEMSLQDFIGDPNPNPYCDPQVQWDPSANRWLFTFLFCNVSSSAQAVVFGWSRTSDPSDLVNGWCAYGGDTTPSLFDYPKLGHSSKYMIIGANLYDESSPSSNPPFQTAALVRITKPANGNIATCSSAFPPSAITAANPLKNADGVTNAFTLVPVNTFTGSGDAYVVSAYDPSGSNGQGASNPRTKLGVWHIDSAGALHQHSDLTVSSYTFPNGAPQPGIGAQLIDTLDGRLTQAVGDPTTGIWTQHTIDGPGGRSVVRWYEIKVSGSTASLTQQGTIASTTDYVFNGAISPRFDKLGAAVFYNRSSASRYPLIAAQERLTATALGGMEPGELILASGNSTDTDFSCGFGGFPCRWGDYAGASPDPVQTNLVWGTNQFVGPINISAPTDPYWITQNFAVVFVGTPSNVTAVAGDRSALVSWAPAPIDPAAPITSYTIHSYDGFFVQTRTVPFPATAMNFNGLTNGVTYRFTVIANSAVGSSPESDLSNPVTPGRAVVQVSPLPTPARDPINQSTAAPSPVGR